MCIVKCVVCGEDFVQSDRCPHQDTCSNGCGDCLTYSNHHIKTSNFEQIIKELMKEVNQ